MWLSIILSSACVLFSLQSAFVEAKVQVHFIPHTHDDVGWLKTVDGYYYDQVQYILDTVVQNLVLNPKRKFMYVEMGFFSRWWYQQDETVQQQVHKLVKNKQLVFVLGGWCMNDEASPHYNSMIDQMTIGHRFLKDKFDIVPRIAWQIDPFGHSSTQASLFASMGFDALYFARMDHYDQEKRKKDKSLEFVWTGSRSLGIDNSLFTGHLQNHYGPPAGLNFDFAPPVKDDPTLKDMNIKDFIETTVEKAKLYASYHKTEHVFFPMGEDFTYTNADLWFKNMDKLIKHVNEDGRVNAFYSDPEIYTDAVHKEKISFPQKLDDFFPYSDNDHSYWTGYFTSRPELKRMERFGMSYLQICKNHEAVLFALSPEEDYSQSRYTGSAVLAEAMGVMQHHDAVSGTSKQFVAFDYQERLIKGFKICQEISQRYLSLLTLKKNSQSSGENLEEIRHCQTSNNSVCVLNTYSSSVPSSLEHTIYAFNPSSDHVKDRVKVSLPRFSGMEFVNVFDQKKGEMISRTIAHTIDMDELEIEFTTETGPLDTSVYTVSYSRPLSKRDLFHNKIENEKINLKNQVQQVLKENESEFWVLSDEETKMSVSICKVTGMIQKIQNDNMENEAKQDFRYYQSYNHSQASGAYIFRPSEQKSMPLVNSKAKVSLVGNEVHVQINEWVKQVVKLAPHRQAVELEMVIGPVDISDSIGKEIIVKFQTDINSKKNFYTDANGREMQKRTLDSRATWDFNSTEPIAQNYYPVNTRCYLKEEDERSPKYFAVSTDRSVGAASLSTGELELMIHRRILHDDGRGVGEPLNEPGADGKGLIIKTKYLISLSESPNLSRELSHQMTYPIHYFSSEKASVEKYFSSYSLLNSALPRNIHLLTFEKWTKSTSARDINAQEKTFLVRFDHFYDATSDEGSLSKATTFDLLKVFNTQVLGKIIEIKETSMTANQLKSDVKRLKWKTTGEQFAGHTAETEKDVLLQQGKILMHPQEIRTFLITFA